MKIKITQNDTAKQVALEGRLDTLTAPDLEKELTPLDGVTDLLIDCKDLEYISSAGLRVLLVAHKAMAQREGLALTNVNEMVGEVLEVTGFASVLNIVKAEG